jgi:hypothetical protein
MSCFGKSSGGRRGRSGLRKRRKLRRGLIKNKKSNKDGLS